MSDGTQWKEQSAWAWLPLVILFLVKDTERKFWLHRVNRACLCLEQIFKIFLSFLLAEMTVCTAQLRDA